MFDRPTDYPCAVTSNHDNGVEDGIQWCLRHLGDADTLTVWTHLKSNLENNRLLADLVSRSSNVEHIVGRGGGSVRSQGPVLMAWADMDDIGRLTKFGAKRITALCVIGWDTASLRPWVSAVQAEVLGDPAVWERDQEDEDRLDSELDPVVVEGLKSLTQMINHNNTISAGFEKDMVVAMLLGLHRHRYTMDPDAVQAWALAHG